MIRTRSAPNASWPTSVTQWLRWALPARLVGHSMGGAALLVSGRRASRAGLGAGGRGHGTGLPRPHHRPVGAVAAQLAGRIRFRRRRCLRNSVSSRAGTSWRPSTGRTAGGGCTGTRPRWIEIAAEWGTRDYWAQWQAVRSPALLIEAGNSVAPAGQMRSMNENGYRTAYLRVADAGHLVHDEAPQAYRQAVESFLAAG